MNQTDLLVEKIINSVIARHCPQRILAISANPRSLPELGSGRRTFIARVETAGLTGAASLDCKAQSLPFEDGSFNMLILHHILVDGQQPELGEAQRVLTGNGQLLVIGRNRFGMHPDTGGHDVPVMDSRSVCRAMKRNAFLIRQCEGIGFRGRALHLDKAWQKAVMPFSDLVLIRGRHTRHNPVVTRLKFSQPQVAGVRSTAHDSLFREAV